MTITGIILVGLIVSAVAIMQQYRNDWVTLDLNNYGHVMLKEISDRISGARDIQVTSFNNMTRIEITDWNNRKSYIDANETEAFSWTIVLCSPVSLCRWKVCTENRISG